MTQATNQDFTEGGKDLRINVYWQKVRAQAEVRGWTSHTSVKENLRMCSHYTDTALTAEIKVERLLRVDTLLKGALVAQRSTHVDVASTLMEQVYDFQGLVRDVIGNNLQIVQEQQPTLHDQPKKLNFGPDYIDPNPPTVAELKLDPRTNTPIEPIDWEDIDEELRHFRHYHPDLYDVMRQYLTKRLARLKYTNGRKILPRRHSDFQTFSSRVRKIGSGPIDAWDISTYETEEMRDKLGVMPTTKSPVKAYMPTEVEEERPLPPMTEEDERAQARYDAEAYIRAQGIGQMGPPT